MQNRLGALILAFLLCVGAVLVLWKSSERPERRRDPRFGGQPTGSLIPVGPGRGMAGSRFFATVAAQAGPLVVSIRNVRPLTGVLGGVQGRPQPMGQFMVLLQITGPEKDLRATKFDVRALTALDNTGLNLACTPSADDNTDATAFPGGLVYRARMEQPGRAATGLEHLDGVVTVAGEQYNFRINNIPLLNIPRLYGRSSPRVIPAALDARLGPSISGAALEEAERLLRETDPAKTPPALTPQFLLLGNRRPAAFNIPTPTDPSRVELSGGMAASGLVDIELRSNGQQWSSQVWDNDLVFIALPRPAHGPRLGLAMRLSREMFAEPSSGPDRASPFPASEGVPAGAVVSSVRVGARPFGRGQIDLSLRRRVTDGWTGWRLTSVPIDQDGSFTVPNLAPGDYQMRRRPEDLAMTPPAYADACPLADYLRLRFQFARGRWLNAGDLAFSLRPAQISHAAPLQYQPEP